jgi:hypothetical protein
MFDRLALASRREIFWRNSEHVSGDCIDGADGDKSRASRFDICPICGTGEACDERQKQFITKIIWHRIVEMDGVLRQHGREAWRTVLGIVNLAVLETSGGDGRFNKTAVFVGIVIFV